MTSTEAFVTEKKFTKEVQSKLMTDHLLFLAIHDSKEFLYQDITVGEDGILYYENGDVYFRIESQSKDIVSVLLYATSIKGGKGEAVYQYHIKEDRLLKWKKW
ncbi:MULTISPECIES: competence type IV pilus minor pilin ComGG [Bacillus]|uniref:competence type IV pilus minor pilin ComGG n=1 Tax=Bacillus TaxID=1386 RepID=UPI0002EBC2C5|nr:MULTISPECIES: competence type IV pilus minor pilin ComGG [Bacillus]